MALFCFADLKAVPRSLEARGELPLGDLAVAVHVHILHDLFVRVGGRVFQAGLTDQKRPGELCAYSIHGRKRVPEHLSS